MLLSEIIQDEIRPLRQEIDELNNSLNRDLKLNYLNSFGRLLEREALDTVNNFNCSYHNTTGKACKSLLTDYITQYTQALSMGDVASAFTILKEFNDFATSNAIDNDKLSQCRKDWTEITRILKRHKEVAKDISALFATREVPSDIAELEFSPLELYNEVIFPFSHPLRIEIVHALKSGSKRFTTLKNELNVKNTGLLVHHLKPLTSSNLVIQDHRKQYSLSDKGFLVARYFSQLTAAMKPQEPITITMQPLVVLQDE
ncbi:MAG: hypothetical protein IH840_03515 [Candidatus Heimdallarchaeota archaeon]|nr:hypothetical protein [Candidatus Heimdallarchaeota archaeon]